MAPRKSIWYQLGLAYERARLGAGDRSTAVDRRPSSPEERSSNALDWPLADELFSAAAWLVLDRVLSPSGGRRKPRFTDLVKAGAAGAAAALLVDLLRPLLRGDADVPLLDERSIDRLLAGVAQGLVYGAVVEPRVPGPALVKGALYGSAEFATDPLGGLSTLFASHTPHGRVPVIGETLEGLDPHDRAFIEHVVFGIALALLYEPDRSSNGTFDDAPAGTS